MGEQMLSREYYYLGTQPPTDRFLTFYYGHPCFHVNNMLIILSVQLFIVTSTPFILQSCTQKDLLFLQWCSWGRSTRSLRYANTRVLDNLSTDKGVATTSIRSIIGFTTALSVFSWFS